MKKQTSKAHVLSKARGLTLVLFLVFLGPQREQDDAHVFCVLYPDHFHSDRSIDSRLPQEDDNSGKT